MAAFAGKHIESSGSRCCIHKLKPDPASREREH